MILLVTDDSALIARVHALDPTITIARNVGEIIPHWLNASMVLVGVDLADRIGRSAPPTRPNVVLVAPDGHEPDFTLAVRLHATAIVQSENLTPELLDAAV